MSPTVLVTGAHGYLGSSIRAQLDAAGWQTIALVRTPDPRDRTVRWELGDVPAEDLLRSADALVHCAYDFSPRDRADLWRVNVEGSASLLQACTNAGVDRLLVLSSMSAYSGTQQSYGQVKLAIEAATLEVGGIAVRPGLVYGPEPRGMAGTLTKLTRLPLVPDFGPEARQYPVHVHDLLSGVQQVLESPTWLSEAFGIAQPDPVTMRTLLLALAEAQGNRVRFVRTPWRAVYQAIRMAERLRVTQLRADSILGLVRPAPEVPPSRGFPHLIDDLRVMAPAH